MFSDQLYLNLQQQDSQVEIQGEEKQKKLKIEDFHVHKNGIDTGFDDIRKSFRKIGIYIKIECDYVMI